MFLTASDRSRILVASSAKNQEQVRSMLPETRRRILIDLVARQGFATLDELVKSLGVSESTVRRDLEALNLGGSVKRTHGGAVYSAEVRTMPALDERMASATAEKEAIGRAAAAL